MTLKTAEVTPSGVRLRLRHVAPAVALLLLAATSPAARVRRLDLTEIRDKADLIILGRVLGQSPRLGPLGKMTWTDYPIQVEEVLKGPGQPARKTLSFAGGQGAQGDIRIVGMPTLEPGRRYVFFLLPDDAPWANPTVGWGQGIFEVVPARSQQEPEVLVSYDGEPLEMTPEGLRRGSLVRRNSEWIEVSENVDRFAARAPLLTREADPLVLNADGKRIDQPPQAAPAKAMTLGNRSFASLDQLRRFVRGETP